MKKRKPKRKPKPETFDGWVSSDNWVSVLAGDHHNITVYRRQSPGVLSDEVPVRVTRRKVWVKP